MFLPLPPFPPCYVTFLPLPLPSISPMKERNRGQGQGQKNGKTGGKWGQGQKRGQNHKLLECRSDLSNFNNNAKMPKTCWAYMTNNSLQPTSWMVYNHLLYNPMLPCSVDCKRYTVKQIDISGNQTGNMSEIFRTTKDTQRLDFFFDDNHDDHDIDET